MDEKEEVCSCCGAVMNKHLMERISTGRKVHYICQECYQHGHREVGIREMGRMWQIERNRRNKK